MFLGVATINSRHDWNLWFVVLTIAFCSIYRTVGKCFVDHFLQVLRCPLCRSKALILNSKCLPGIKCM
jgi:hypothetical protein